MDLTLQITWNTIHPSPDPPLKMDPRSARNLDGRWYLGPRGIRALAPLVHPDPLS